MNNKYLIIKLQKILNNNEIKYIFLSCLATLKMSHNNIFKFFFY